MYKPIRYDAIQAIGTLDDENYVRVNWAMWNGGDIKLDIRRWVVTHCEERPGRGITLTANEARNLYALLRQMNDENGIEPPEL